MVRIGIIGIGFMGYTHFEASKKLDGAKVTAISTRDEKKLAGDWTSMPELVFAGWTVGRDTASVYGREIADDEQWGSLGGLKIIPRVSSICEQLEQAYSFGRKYANDPELAQRARAAARAGALAYDVRTIAEQYWRPLLTEMEGRL